MRPESFKDPLLEGDASAAGSPARSRFAAPTLKHVDPGHIFGFRATLLHKVTFAAIVLLLVVVSVTVAKSGAAGETLIHAEKLACEYAQGRIEREHNVTLSDSDIKTCNLIAQLMVESRWILYLFIDVGMLSFILILLGAFAIGSNLKPRRPHYWKNRLLFRDDFYEEVDVTDHMVSNVTMKALIQEMFDAATDKQRMGKGADGKWNREVKKAHNAPTDPETMQALVKDLLDPNSAHHAPTDQEAMNACGQYFDAAREGNDDDEEPWIRQYDGFEVLKVTRIENGKLWSDYARMRKSMSKYSDVAERLSDECKARFEKCYDDLKNMTWRKKPKIKEFIESLQLKEEKNETLLFNGLPGKGARNPLIRSGSLYNKQLWLDPEDDSPVEAVKETGFESRIARLEGMFGSGTYFADMVSKADCYAGKYNDLDASDVNQKATLVIARVALGTSYCAEQALEQLRRPPCIEEHFDYNLKATPVNENQLPWDKKEVTFKLCKCQRFDSVLSTTTTFWPKKKLYHEYVVYAPNQAYPEFFVEYRRIKKRPEGTVERGNACSVIDHQASGSGGTVATCL